MTAKPSRRKARKAKRSPLGAAPGTLIADPGARQPVVSVTALSPERTGTFENVGMDELRRLRSEWPALWVDCVGLGDVGMIAAIGALFGLHHLALEDVVNTGQRPKAEIYDDHAFVVLKMLHAGPETGAEQLSLFFGENYVVTFQERPGDAFDPVRRRIADGGKRLLARKSDYLAYALIDAVVDGYFPVVDASGDAIDAVEDTMLDDPKLDRSQALHKLRREMIALKRWLWPVRDAVATLIRTEHDCISAETRLFYSDTLDHVVRLIEIVETYREMLTGLIEMNISLVQARTNDIISVLTIISVIFIPLTFMVGVWGMNFDPSASPWNMPELEWRYGYPLALGLMLAVGIGLLAFFRWKKWL